MAANQEQDCRCSMDFRMYMIIILSIEKLNYLYCTANVYTYWSIYGLYVRPNFIQ